MTETESEEQCTVLCNAYLCSATWVTKSDRQYDIPELNWQFAYVTLKQRKRHAKIRRPSTPIVSKVKKIKLKTYSSYKGRSRTMNDGQIRRWREGTLCKFEVQEGYTQAQRTNPLAYAKVMKKLKFSAHY